MSIFPSGCHNESIKHESCRETWPQDKRLGTQEEGRHNTAREHTEDCEPYVDSANGEVFGPRGCIDGTWRGLWKLHNIWKGRKKLVRIWGIVTCWSESPSKNKQSQWPGGVNGDPTWEGVHSIAVRHTIIITFNLNSQVLAKVLITLRQVLREEEVLV